MMLNDLSKFRHIYIACGYTDLRRGIDGLAGIVKHKFELDPVDEGSIFLFCGRRTDRIKALLFEGDGFVLLYKRLSDGNYQWPRTAEEVREDGCCRIEQKNKFSVGEQIEIMKPDGRNVLVTVKGITDEDGNVMESAPHPKQVLWVDLGSEVSPYDILRRSEME